MAAVTVSTEDVPAAIDVGFALIATVGAKGETDTVAVAEDVPFLFIAVAVYVVVPVGFTDCVPPVAARLYDEPSLPITVTCVAFTEAIVSVELCPTGIDVGLAVIVMPGFIALVLPENKAHPEATRQIEVTTHARTNREASEDKCLVDMVFSLILLEGNTNPTTSAKMAYVDEPTRVFHFPNALWPMSPFVQIGFDWLFNCAETLSMTP